MLSMVQADHGYEKTVSGGTTTMLIRRNRSAFLTLIWMCATGLCVLLVVMSTQVNNGRGSAPVVFLGLCLVPVGVATLFSLGRSHTRVVMGTDRLSLDGGAEYAKKDIVNIRIHDPGVGAFTYTSDLDYQSKVAMRSAVARQSHYVTFDYGSTTVLLAGKLTAPQADRVGTEFADWLGA